jgi:hypothetical protein
MKPDQLSTGKYVIGIKNVNDIKFHALRIKDSDEINIYWYDGVHHTTTHSGFSFSTNKWVHIAVCYDYSESILLIYQDGVLIANKTDAIQGLGTFTMCHIGDDTFGSSFFDGNVDEYKIYPYLLRIHEIREIIGGNRLNDVYLYYNFEQISGITCYDQSGNNNNGNITGATETGSFIYDSSKDDNWQQIHFDGNDDVIDLNSWDLSGYNQGSFGCWVKFNDDSEQYMFNYRTADGNESRLWFDWNFDVVRFIISKEVGINSIDLQTNSEPTADIWHHFVVTQNGSKAILYWN